MYQRFLNILYPLSCPFCGRILGKSVARICGNCEKKIIYMKEPRCKRCGKPIRTQEAEFCLDCQRGRFCYDQGKSLYLHQSPVKEAVYQLKYHNKRIYGEMFAQELYRIYKEQIKSWGVDVILPVPLHHKRRKKRGYNQAELIATELGKLTSLSVETDAVYRVKNTNPQKVLDNRNRAKNLSHAFAVSRKWRVRPVVLLIDDIYTTGSTINSVAKILKKRGVQKVYFLTISIGQGL
ncbi:MAG: ComF family protein [Hespellia sp.]|nr:ComF family protein [Hespellia sp.]